MATRFRFYAWLTLVIASTSSTPSVALAEVLTADDSLPQKAVQLLHDHCFSCHNDEDRKGDLSLTAPLAIQEANQEFDLLVPGSATESVLIQVLAADADPHMPPKKQLEASDIATLTAWVDLGAPWPDRPEPGTESLPPLSPRSELQPLPSSYRPVLALALDPKDERLAFSRGHRLVLVDQPLADSPIQTELAGHRAPIQALNWHPQEPTQLVSGGYRRLVYWNTAIPEPQHILEDGLEGQVSAFAFSPDGSFLYVAVSRPAQTATLIQFEIPTFEERARWPAHTDTIFALSLSPEGNHLASASGDRTVAIWQTDTLAEQRRIEAHNTQIMDLGFSPDGRRLVTVGTDQQLRVWAWSLGDPLFNLGRHKRGLFAVEWSADGKTIIATDESSAVFRYTEIGDHDGMANARPAQEKRIYTTSETIQSLTLDCAGKTIFIGTQSGTVRAIDPNGKLLKELKPSKEVVSL